MFTDKQSPARDIIDLCSSDDDVIVISSDDRDYPFRSTLVITSEPGQVVETGLSRRVDSYKSELYVPGFGDFPISQHQTPSPPRQITPIVPAVPIQTCMGVELSVHNFNYTLDPISSVPTNKTKYYPLYVEEEVDSGEVILEKQRKRRATPEKRPTTKKVKKTPMKMNISSSSSDGVSPVEVVAGGLMGELDRKLAELTDKPTSMVALPTPAINSSVIVVAAPRSGLDRLMAMSLAPSRTRAVIEREIDTLAANVVQATLASVVTDDTLAANVVQATLASVVTDDTLVANVVQATLASVVTDDTLAANVVQAALASVVTDEILADEMPAEETIAVTSIVDASIGDILNDFKLIDFDAHSSTLQSTDDSQAIQRLAELRDKMNDFSAAPSFQIYDYSDECVSSRDSIASSIPMNVPARGFATRERRSAAFNQRNFSKYPYQYIAYAQDTSTHSI